MSSRFNGLDAAGLQVKHRFPSVGTRDGATGTREASFTDRLVVSELHRLEADFAVGAFSGEEGFDAEVGSEGADALHGGLHVLALGRFQPERGDAESRRAGDETQIERTNLQLMVRK